MVDVSCAFTGHQPQKYPLGYGEDAPDCIKLKQALTARIVALVEVGITDYLSGMAQGAALALRDKNPALKLHCILPCEGQADK